jgi:aminoglycoside phosphotransferase (APT) family kinase protein
VTPASAVPNAQRDTVNAIAQRFGIPERSISIAPRQGQVNLTVFLGDDLVVRLPRRPDLEGRLVKEAELIPFLRERDIPTPELISFDPSHTIAEVNYIVLQRIRGQEIADIAPPSGGNDRVYGSLFAILDILHTVGKEVEQSIPSVEESAFSDEELLDELARSGEIGGSQASWLRRWFLHLEAHGARSSEPRLLHGDVMPSNLILNEAGRVAAIIDWGSARWGEPARDLAGFRTSTLPAVVDIYRQSRHADPADDRSGIASLEASVLWYQLFFALAKLLGKQSTSETRNWSAPRAARFLEILRFLSTEAPDRWRALLLTP